MCCAPSLCICIFILQFGFPVAEPGVPYNITVKASTAAGKGEPVSIIVFTVQQGKIVLMTRYKSLCAKFAYKCSRNEKHIISCVHM